MDNRICYGCMQDLKAGSMRCDCGFDPGTYEAAPHQLVPGTVLHERYMVGRVIGEGGFGITYVGRDTVLDLKVAVKEFYMSGYVNRNNTVSTVVNASVGSHAELFERNKEKFLTEARVLAKFADEEGIVGIRDYFQENNTAYIVMDFLTGKTLRDYIGEVKKLSWQDTLGIMRPILSSLSNIHAHQIIHRDISPDNIMLTTDGKVKLLDFGAAREVSQTDIKSLSVILKPGYAPEEQYRSKGHQGPWTDIYALCATIYCCITGMVPEDSMERMFEDKLITLHEAEPSCKLAISEVIMKGMAVRQKDRYRTIAELQADLDRAVEAPEGVSLGIDAGGSSTGQDVNSNIYTAEPAKQAPDINATVYAGEIRTAEAEELTNRNGIQTGREDEAAGGAEINEPQKGAGAAGGIRVSGRDRSTGSNGAKGENEAKPAAKKKSSGGKGKFVIIAAAILAVLVVGGILLSMALGSGNGTYGGSDSRASTGTKDDKVLEILKDSTLVLNSKEVKFPILYSEFVKYGWDIKDPAELDTVLTDHKTSSSYTFLNVEKGFGTIEVRFINPSESEKSLRDSYICGLYAYSSHLNSDNYANKEANTVILKTSVMDLVLGETLEDDFVTAFSLKKKSGSDYSFNISENRVINLEFQKNILIYMRVENRDDPEGFADSYASEPPEYDERAFFDAADPGFYVKLVRDDGTEYEMGVSVLLKDYLDEGWTAEDAPEYLKARGTANVHLRKDARTVQAVKVVNPTGEARSTECCFVTRLDVTNTALLTGDSLILVDNEDSKGEYLISGSYTDAFKKLDSAYPDGSIVTLPGDYKLDVNKNTNGVGVNLQYTSSESFREIVLDSTKAVQEFFK